MAIEIVAIVLSSLLLVTVDVMVVLALSAFVRGEYVAPHFARPHRLHLANPHRHP